jgi:hypothetical protein
MGVVNTSGRLSLLRVHERGSKFGPPNDQIDVEVVVAFVSRPNDFFGFQLRTDANAAVREGMLGLLRDGFNHNWIVNLDFDQQPNRRNSVLLRVWLTKPASGGGGGGGIILPDATKAAARSRRPARKTAAKAKSKRRS